MKILLRIFLVGFFLSIFSFLKLNTSPAYAANCTISVTSTTVANRTTSFTVNLGNLDSNRRYFIVFSNSNNDRVQIDNKTSFSYTTSLDSIGYRGATDSNMQIWGYTGTGTNGNIPDYCQGSPISITVGSGGNCSIDKTTANVGDDIKVTPSGLTGSNPIPVHLVGIFLTPVNHLGDLQPDGFNQFKAQNFKIPDTQAGGYQVLLNFDASNPANSTSCGALTIGESGGQLTSGRNPCQGGICITALGSIPTNLKEFSEKILSIATGVAGGIAFILMVTGAIRILTSQGDPKGVAGGREMLVAALAGLLFLIFSVLILRFIGINLLGGIPGIG